MGFDDARFVCLFCNEEFYVPKYRAKNHPKFCSLKCKYDSMKNGIKTKCLHCGREFVGRRNRVLKGWDKYCSNECADKSRIKRYAFTCANCGKECEVHRYLSSRRKFCSSKCRNDYREDRVTFECVVCGKTKSVKRSFYSKSKGVHTCSKKCLAEYQRSDCPDLTKRSTFVYRCWRFFCLKRDKYRCVLCGDSGSKSALHVHHIKSFKDYPEYRYDQVNRN
jgi:hypothetical protein